jgi:hypothetical protein
VCGQRESVRDVAREDAMTGYWSHGGERTRIHLVNDGATRPWCGANLHRDAQFYWVTRNDRVENVECERCRRIAAKREMETK